MWKISITVGKLQQVENQVQNFTTLFWICIIGMVLFAAVTVFLFAYFHIGGIFMELTGLKRRREIQKIYKKNVQKSNDRKQVRKRKTDRYQSIINRTERITERVTEKVTENLDETVVLEESSYTDIDATTVLDTPQEFVIEKEIFMAGTEESI